MSKEEILKVFKQNFQYSIVDTPLGTAVKMPSRDAFLFCNVTGSGYLDNFIYPFTPKGLMKLFYNAFDYKFVTGIFEKTSLRNTPYILSRAKPFLFDSAYKYVVPIAFNSEIELQDYVESKFNSLDKSTDYIIMRVEMRKNGHGLESFMEYLAGEYFKKKGFIVENQVPLAYAVGSPDFGGYDLTSIKGATSKYLEKGFHIIELSMLRLHLPQDKYACDEILGVNLLVGEAKTSTKIMDSQLRKYLNTGLYDWGMEIHPNKQSPTYNDRGMFTLDDDYNIKFTPPQRQYEVPTHTGYSRDSYYQWLENYMKFYVLANLTNDELNMFYTKKVGRSMSDQHALTDFVESLTINEIINEVSKYL